MPFGASVRGGRGAWSRAHGGGFEVRGRPSQGVEPDSGADSVAGQNIFAKAVPLRAASNGSWARRRVDSSSVTSLRFAKIFCTAS